MRSSFILKLSIVASIAIQTATVEGASDPMTVLESPLSYILGKSVLRNLPDSIDTSLTFDALLDSQFSDKFTESEMK